MLNTPPDETPYVGVQLTVGGVAAGGRGVARQDGLVWLLEGGLPGDRVVAEEVRRHPRWVEGRVVERLGDGPGRRPPPCLIQGACGGCPFMPLDEGLQRHWKRRLVADALARIGAEPVEVDEVRASPESLGYRNKVELALGRGADGRIVVGYHRRGSTEGVVEVPRCLLQSDAGNACLETLRWYFDEGDGSADPSLSTPAALAQARLIIRSARDSGSLLVGLHGPASLFERSESLAREVMAAHPRVAGVVRLVTHPGRRGGVQTQVLAGSPWLTERVGGIEFEIPAGSFFQVNPGAAEILLHELLELAGDVSGLRVLELYGGVGVFALACAARGARARVCETDPEAVAAGRRTAARAGLRAVRFVRADVGRYLASTESPRADLVIADPPRAGLAPGVAAAIAAIGPEKILLVSCDPATLARDLRAFRGRGYEAKRVIPVDLFPQTAHIETVSLLCRASATSSTAGD